MDFLVEYKDLITGVLILFTAGIILPRILRPLRPRQQSNATLNTLSRLKSDDIMEMNTEQWERVKFLIAEEQKVILAKASARSNDWLGKIMNNQRGEDTF